MVRPSHLIVACLVVSSASALFGFGDKKDDHDDPVNDDDPDHNDDDPAPLDEDDIQEEVQAQEEEWTYDPDVHHYGQNAPPQAPVDYGVDVSFPMHHGKIDKSVPQPLGDRQAWYDDFMKQCRKHYGKRGSMCDSTERDRVQMSLRQPKDMFNYTDIGFKKIRTPPDLWVKLEKFWRDNHDQQAPERWPAGNTYTNHWRAPTHMVSVDNGALRGQRGLKQEIWEAARETISEWTGMELTPVSLYGIRVYKEGAVLAPHVDRMPLISSAIVNVAQDVEEPWPLEVISHDGKAYNVTMEPGDMVLYESHSVLHGRPFPLKGKFFANCFIHFEPIGHSKRHHGLEGGEDHDVDKKHKEANNKGQGGHEQDASDGLPDYILKGSNEEKRWRMSHPDNASSVDTRSRTFATGSNSIHNAAKTGDIKTLERIINKNKKAVHERDENGWMALHEAGRGGFVQVAERLLDAGADVNARTNGGLGGSVLWWAQNELGEESSMVRFLKSRDAKYIEPEL